MGNVRQGEIIRFEGTGTTALVLSKEFFNATGIAVVCPVVSSASADALHIAVRTGAVSGTAMLEHLKSVDLKARHYQTMGSVVFEKVQELSDAVQSMFDYYPFSI